MCTVYYGYTIFDSECRQKAITVLYKDIFVLQFNNWFYIL